MKICRKCGVQKEPEFFHSHKLTKDGLNSHCKQCVAAAAVAWKKTNKSKAAAHQKKWNATHPDKMIAATKKWKVGNMPTVRASASAWQKAHPAGANKRNARHRAEKLQATPAWANEKYMEDCYAQAAIRTKRDGKPWHVDHIVPLRGKLVCGLHWEENFEVIPGVENARKGNRYWPDMPEQRA